MTTPTHPRVRFAPSPTGYLHVGGARTALFNWLFARRNGGAFILRVEDTDLERNRPELVEGILASLRWLGLEWDEGPFHQSERLELYKRAAERLLAQGTAYKCFCKASAYAGGDAAPDANDEGDAEKPHASLKAGPCPCRKLSPAELVEKESHGELFAARFAVPRDGVTRFEDAVFGPREFQNTEIEDFVLLRSSGLPTYQLGVVVDDIDMRITHVLRGADHLSNTPKQVLIYEALGASPPIFAHVPLILGPDRMRLSKRHGATSVGSYQEEGFLPEAFRNFLALLGWSPGDDAEFMRTPELIERFDLSGVSHSNGIFDRAKLEWFNTQYLQKPPVEDLLPYVEEELRRAGLWREVWASGEGREWLARTVDLIRPRTRFLTDFTGWARAFFSDEFEYEPAAREKFWKDDRVASLFAVLLTALQTLPQWDHDSCDHALRAVAESTGVKAGLLINATRVAIVGRAVAPPLFDTMLSLGRQRTLDRIQLAISALTTG